MMNHVMLIKMWTIDIRAIAIEAASDVMMRQNHHGAGLVSSGLDAHALSAVEGSEARRVAVPVCEARGRRHMEHVRMMQWIATRNAGLVDCAIAGCDSSLVGRAVNARDAGLIDQTSFPMVLRRSQVKCSAAILMGDAQHNAGHHPWGIVRRGDFFDPFGGLGGPRRRQRKHDSDASDPDDSRVRHVKSPRNCLRNRCRPCLNPSSKTPICKIRPRLSI